MIVSGMRGGVYLFIIVLWFCVVETSQDLPPSAPRASGGGGVCRAAGQQATLPPFACAPRGALLLCRYTINAVLWFGRVLCVAAIYRRSGACFVAPGTKRGTYLV